MAIMDLNGVLNLLADLVKKNPGNVDSQFLAHSKDSYVIASEIVEKIISKYPPLSKKLNKREVALAAGLHDIGRPFQNNQLFHELRGAKYIEEHGLKIGISDNQETVNKIAQMFRPHLVVAEQFEDPENQGESNEFRPIDSLLLLPRTWQEKIVVYSELTNRNGKRMTIQERIDDLQERYSPGSDWAKSNPSVTRAMQKGIPRVLSTCKKVEMLMQGKLTEQEIAQYGFI